MKTRCHLVVVEIPGQAWKADITGIITPINADLPLRRVSDNLPDGLKSGFKEEDNVILCPEWDEFLGGERGCSWLYRALRCG